ncbi:MAG: hypothetical protein WCJ09_22850 [Planctomycetota bacterium]
MFHGALALLERSLRTDARSWQTHLVRLGLMVGIYVALVFVLTMAWQFGAPGLRFFSAIVYLNVACLTLLGISFFSTTITEEKEEDTLGLMLMAGISPLGLLIGKLGGRLVQALLLIAIQYPFTLLAITMGGVSLAQVQAVYVGLGSYMVLLAGGGLLCSTLAPRTRTAGTWMVVALFVYGVVPFLCQQLVSNITRFIRVPSHGFLMFLDTIASCSLFTRVGNIIVSGFGDSAVSLQAVSNVSFGLFCFGLSWCCFGYASREPATEATTRTGLSRSQRGIGRSFSPGRAWKNAFAWKDFHFTAGGLSRRLVRIVFYPFLFVLCMGASLLWGIPQSNSVSLFLGWAMIFLVWESALLVAWSVQEEVRGQTLASLVMLPRSVPSVFYSKFMGTVAGMYPGILCLTVGCCFDVKNVLHFFWFEGHAILALLLLVPHFAAVYALFVRWGAVPLAIGTMIMVYFAVVMLFNLIRPSPSGIYVLTFVLLIICATCHILVLRLIPRVAARS